MVTLLEKVFTVYLPLLGVNLRHFGLIKLKQNYNASKKQKVPGLFIRSGELYELYTSYWSIVFGGTV